MSCIPTLRLEHCDSDLILAKDEMNKQAAAMRRLTLYKTNLLTVLIENSIFFNIIYTALKGLNIAQSLVLKLTN